MMKGKKKFGISLVFLISATVLALIQVRCKHDGLDVSTLDKVCYQRDIEPIFRNSCGITGCHGQQRGESGYTFTDYSSIIKAITPFDANKSKAYQAITGKGFVQLMPPAGALTQNERILIRVWIDQGAVQTTCN